LNKITLGQARFLSIIAVFGLNLSIPCWAEMGSFANNQTPPSPPQNAEAEPAVSSPGPDLPFTPPPVDECGLPLTPVLSGYDPILMKDYPELAPHVERVNFCLPVREAKECLAKPMKILDSQEISEFQGYLQDKSQAKEEIRRFHESASDSPLEHAHNSYSHLTKVDGFQQRIISVKQFYRYQEHKYFHGSAAALDAINLFASRYELNQHKRARQIAQEIYEKIPNGKAFDCQRKYMGQQMGLLDSEIEKLQMAADQLSHMASTNSQREENMKALPGMVDSHSPLKNESDVTGTVKTGEKSSSGEVSGEEKLGFFKGSNGHNQTSSDGNDTKEKIEKTGLVPKHEDGQTLVEQTLLELLSLSHKNGRNLAGSEGQNESLFVRVHQKYRQKDSSGTFLKGPLDGPRDEILPGLSLKEIYAQPLVLP
jgi:hypothetical protein